MVKVKSYALPVRGDTPDTAPARLVKGSMQSLLVRGVGLSRSAASNPIQHSIRTDSTGCEPLVHSGRLDLWNRGANTPSDSGLLPSYWAGAQGEEKRCGGS